MSGVRLLLRILSALTLPAAITLATPHGLCAQGTSGGTQAQNVRAERSGSIVDISYDLPDAAGAVFSVTIEVSSNGGQSFDIKPTSTTGDIGATIGAGRGKKISWDSAKDVDTLQFDQYRFRVNAVRVDVPPPPPPPKPSTGSLVVRSTPSGAAVSIDGQARGATPVTINELAVGSHRIIVSKDGYLENSSQVTVEQSKTAVVEKQLTAAPAPPKQTGGGSNPAKWIIPALAHDRDAGALEPGAKRARQFLRARRIAVRAHRIHAHRQLGTVDRQHRALDGHPHGSLDHGAWIVNDGPRARPRSQRPIRLVCPIRKSL